MSRNAVQLARARLPQVKQHFIAFGGGLDTETPPLFVPAGYIRESQNVECDILGGYRTIQGYERFDGRPSPSNAAYARIDVTISGTFAVGDTITGATSGATATVIALVTSGAPNYLVVTKISGTFVESETLNVSGSPQGTAISRAVIDGGPTSLLHAQYKNLAADEYRNDITAVPGSGRILGVVRLNDVTYAFRNNSSGTAAAIYKSSPGGWVAVPTGSEVGFTNGSGSVDEGDTLTQGGVTATIKRLVITSGSLGAGTAAGRLVIHSVSGGSFSAGAATTTGGGTLTLSGAEESISIQPDGSYEFIVENFGGLSGTNRIYGCDGQNRGFEFDGTDYSYTPIATGMQDDTPDHVAAHKNHLFFFFGSSAQHSAPGLPYVWSVVLGAAEIAMGDEITGAISQPGSESGGALVIFTRNRTSILYGNGVSTWVLVPYRKELGAYPRTIQDIGIALFLDDRGVTSFQTAQTFGNFSHAVLTERIKSWINTQRARASASSVSRNKSQYRLFFNDKYAIYMTMRGATLVGVGQAYFKHPVSCIWSSEDSDGQERTFFGSTNGMIYELDKGTSFDGETIEWRLYLAFDSLKSPRTLKAFKEAMLEVSGLGYSGFNFAYELGYGSADIPQPVSVVKTASFYSSRWDAPGAVWDSLFWDGRTLSKQVVDLGGTAENISLMFSGASDYDSPLKFSGALVHYLPRRHLR